MGDKFVKSWEMKNPNARHTLVVELWERPDGTRYRKTHKKWPEMKNITSTPTFLWRRSPHARYSHTSTQQHNPITIEDFSTSYKSARSIHLSVHEEMVKRRKEKGENCFFYHFLIHLW